MVLSPDLCDSVIQIMQSNNADIDISMYSAWVLDNTDIDINMCSALCFR